MKRPFVHLHVHSEYSLLDGAIRCRDLAGAVRDMGMDSVALTDHGAMYGCVEFYRECLAAGVKPVLGCEVYVAPRGHTCREGKEQFHLVLLAENEEGYRNLVRLVSIAHTDGFYYKPRVDHDLLARYGKGLIACSACLGGEVPTLIANGDEDGALARAQFYRDLFGDGNFFLEIQANAIPAQAIVNKTLAEMARSHGFPLVATADSHYMRQQDASWHDVLLCVQTNSNVNDPNRYRFFGNDFYLRSPEEMWSIFGDELPAALTNTQEIADRCSVEMKFGEYHLPNYEIPEGETLATHLRDMAEEGLRSRLGNVEQIYTERLDYELGVIEQMGFPGYFCIVSDIICQAKKMGIPVGPGRGSAAGSLVAWATGITELDPIKHDLLFERFLNPERVSMPDIDTDISDKRRDEVIDYVVEKYGADHVAGIITFGRMMSKAAVKDVGRALGMPYSEVDRVAKMIPDPLRSGIKSIPEAIAKTPDLRAAADTDGDVRRLLEIASNVEGLARHPSKHAAGVVITPLPTREMLPVTRIKDSHQVVTQFPMEPVEKLGLVKMDFLGLRTLSIIEGALENIKISGYKPVDLEKIPMDDEKTYDMLKAADTLGVFQLESSGMRDLIRRLQPDCFADIVALMALYRPGPLESGMADQYVKRKHGKEKVEYPHPCLEDALSSTYGVILYQEQVMQCAALLAGYTLGEADILRRAMGKKKVEEMERQRSMFVSGAKKRGVSEAKAGEIFDIIEKFAGYGFNKSHSAAYALISYQTAYLKAHYGAEFLASYLSALVGSKMEELGRYVGEVRALGFEIAPPDINLSRGDFTVTDGIIRFGLSAIAKVGASALESIIGARDRGGPYRSLWDFLTRIDLRAVNRGVLENMIKSGAFDSTSPNRHRLLSALPGFVDMAARKEVNSSQRSLFDDDEAAMGEPEMPEEEEYPQDELLKLEKESMGIYISGHPYDRYRSDEVRYATCGVRDLAYWKAGGVKPTVLGLVTEVREKFTKRGDPMGVFSIEDAESQVEVVCFPRKWPSVKPILVKGSAYLVSGELRLDGDLSIMLDEIEPIEEARARKQGAVRIRVATAGLDSGFYQSLREELVKYPGSLPVLLELQTPQAMALVKMKTVKVSKMPGLAERIAHISEGRASVLD